MKWLPAVAFLFLGSVSTAGIRPILSPCPTQCSVILNPTGGDDTSAIQDALYNPQYSTVCLRGSYTFHISAPIHVPSGKKLVGYRYPALIDLPPYQSPTVPGFSTAIVVDHNSSNVGVACLIVDGGYPSTCLPSTHPMPGEPSYSALVLVGNNVRDSYVRRLTLRNPAGWTALQWGRGGTGNVIASNTVEGAGWNYTNGADNFWSDGISVYASSIIVDGNTVIDATDQAIVVWGTNTTISGNKIYAKQRYCFGAITFAD